jgi:hypothetical protein
MSNPNEETEGLFAASTRSRFLLGWMTCSGIRLFFALLSSLLKSA